MRTVMLARTRMRMWVSMPLAINMYEYKKIGLYG